jgi:hypothetical protein
VDWAGVALAAVAGAVAGGLAHVVMRRIGGSRLVRMLGNPAAATDHTKLCAAVGGLYGEILALPPAEQGTTIRYLLASARAQHPLSPPGGGGVGGGGGPAPLFLYTEDLFAEETSGQSRARYPSTSSLVAPLPRQGVVGRGPGQHPPGVRSGRIVEALPGRFSRPGG